MKLRHIIIIAFVLLLPSTAYSGKSLKNLQELRPGVWEDGSKKHYFGRSKSAADITVDSLIITDLTASRLISTDASKIISSVANLATWIAGTANQITVTNDGDGSVTLSTPQDISSGSTVAFYRLGIEKIYHAYGGFQGESETVSISGATTWTMITNGTNDLWTGLEADGITLSGDIMTFANGGDYFGTLSITLSGSNGKDFQIRVYNITQSTQGGYVIGISTKGAGNFSNVTLPLYLEVTANDQYRMEIRNITDATDPTFRSAVFYISYLHN